MERFRIEELSSDGVWRSYSSNTSREWAEKDVELYKAKEPNKTFRVEPDNVRQARALRRHAEDEIFEVNGEWFYVEGWTFSPSDIGPFEYKASAVSQYKEAVTKHFEP